MLIVHIGQRKYTQVLISTDSYRSAMKTTEEPKLGGVSYLSPERLPAHKVFYQLIIVV